MKSVMAPQHRFSEVPQANIERSTFDRSHGLKTTFDAGYLIPVLVDEMVPGDTFAVKMTAFARMATLIRPIMDNLYLDSFFFFVPNRLIWANFKKFMGEQLSPGDSTTFYVPQVPLPASPGVVSNTLYDYFGCPVGLANSVNVNNLHGRAYNLIWNEWFRDQNMQTPVTLDTGDGPDTYSNYVLQRRGKRHDYFTSCLPWPQKTQTGAGVTIPLGTSATVKANSTPFLANAQTPIQWLSATAGAQLPANRAIGTGSTQDNKLYPTTTATTDAGGGGIYASNLYADLSTATAATVNALRLAFQTQVMYERDARGGTRYIELVKSHYNVTSPDLRATRPVYLGGGSTPINVNTVAGTNQLGTGATSPAYLSAFATATASGHGFTYSATEHGVLLGLISVRADLTYSQGLERMWTRRTRLDYYFPALAHLGEQAVLNKEIYCQGDANDDAVFGYQERFAEMRYFPSRITGLMRSNVSTGKTSIDVYHLSQNFGSLPNLTSGFIADTPPITRVIAVTTEPQFIMDAYFQMICARPMPVYSVPGLIDHF